jgi:hypothetical protein
MSTISTRFVGDHKIEAWHDPDPEDPREWDQLGTMVCFHSRYKLGDKHNLSLDEAYLVEKKGMFGGEKIVSLPLWLYDHSGLRISTSEFADQWDAGKVGFIFVTYDKIKKSHGWKRITPHRIDQIKSWLRNEVKEYDAYLLGAVYGYTLFDGKGEIVDSCGGFYGDHEEMMNMVADGIKDPIVDLMEAANASAVPNPENGGGVRV